MRSLILRQPMKKLVETLKDFSKWLICPHQWVICMWNMWPHSLHYFLSKTNQLCRRVHYHRDLELHARVVGLMSSRGHSAFLATDCRHNGTRQNAQLYAENWTDDNILEMFGLQSIMTPNKFQLILDYLHLNNNTNCLLSVKIRPLLAHLSATWKTSHTPHCEMRVLLQSKAAQIWVFIYQTSRISGAWTRGPCLIYSRYPVFQKTVRTKSTTNHKHIVDKPEGTELYTPYRQSVDCSDQLLWKSMSRSQQQIEALVYPQEVIYSIDVYIIHFTKVNSLIPQSSVWMLQEGLLSTISDQSPELDADHRNCSQVD